MKTLYSNLYTQWLTVFIYQSTLPQNFLEFFHKWLGPSNSSYKTSYKCICSTILVLWLFPLSRTVSISHESYYMVCISANFGRTGTLWKDWYMVIVVWYKSSSCQRFRLYDNMSPITFNKLISWCHIVASFHAVSPSCSAMPGIPFGIP